MKAYHMQSAYGNSKCKVCDSPGYEWIYWKAAELSKKEVDVLAVYCSAKCSTEDYNAKI